MAPPDNLKDLFFTFNNLSSCNLSSMVEQLSESVRISICPGWLYIWWSKPTLIRICTPYTYIFWTIWLIDLLTLEESYRRIGLAFTADLSFNLSFDRAILKNLSSHLLGLRLAKGVPALSLLMLCLCQILSSLLPAEALKTCCFFCSSDFHGCLLQYGLPALPSLL